MNGDFNNILNLYQRLRANPMNILSLRFNIPQNINSPDEIIQHLLNTGQVTQEQFNRAVGLRDNPIIKRLMNTH